MKTFLEFCLRDIAHGAATSPLNDLDPSEAQLNAGNYKKGQVRLHGMRISIENPQGSIRRGVDPTGVKWACTMQAHYGYFKGTTGADGGHVDCFLGPDCENPKCPVFVVNQIRVHGEEFGIFDEHKVMLGYCDRNSAIAGYLINFSPGWKGLGSIEETTIHGLRNWLSHGDTQAPFEQNTIKESRMENLVEFLTESVNVQPSWKSVEKSVAKDYEKWVEEVKKSVIKSQHNADVAKSFSSALNDWLISKGHTEEELINDPDWAISGKKFFNGREGGFQLKFKWGGVLSVRIENGSIMFSETTGSFKKS